MKQGKYLRYIHFFILTFLKSNVSFAGLPYFTDNPVTTTYQHWNFYLWANFDKSNFFSFLQAPAVEADYGILPNAEITLAVPLMTSFVKGGPTTTGIGDCEFTVKYRFLEETQFRPQMSLGTYIELPIGSFRRNLGNGTFWYKFPVAIQKTLGSWIITASIGYNRNPAAYANDFWFGGIVLQRVVSDKLTVGAEMFSQGAFASGIGSTTLVNFGFNYQVNKIIWLIGSLGHSVAATPNFVGYFTIIWDIKP